ncbi:MAG TPA: hypothetical protein VFU49_15695 [Ktedonobacteraceae bacterium]|nr:hypothetical protein [Ktedonobacteraceae bacterium]
MDISTTIAHVQFLIFTWTLLGFLLAWLFTFAWLALRPDPQKKAELEDSSLFSHAIPTTTVPTVLQAIARQPLQIQTSSMEQEPGYEVGKAPIA